MNKLYQAAGIISSGLFLSLSVRNAHLMIAGRRRNCMYKALPLYMKRSYEAARSFSDINRTFKEDQMETKANIIRKYADATPETKVDIICKYYPQIDGIINARIAAMKYIIWEEKEKNRRVDYGELGVRVQSGNGYSDPTGNEASFRANLENAIRKCDFSGDILEGIGDSEKIIEEAYILKDMKEIQHLYNLQVDCLISEERNLYQKYLNQEMTLTDIASSCGIEYHSAVKKITKIRKSVNQEITEILEVTSCHVGTK